MVAVRFGFRLQDAGYRIQDLYSASKPPTGITGSTGSTGSTVHDAGYKIQDTGYKM
jgi:hypothetical protein